MFADYSDLNPDSLPARLRGATTLKVPKRVTLFSQEDRSDAVYFLRSGRVKLVVVSPEGKEAVIAVLEPGSFFGEHCLSESGRRRYAAIAADASEVLRLSCAQATELMREDDLFASYFFSYVLARCRALEDDLSNQLLNQSEKRLARVLLSIAASGDADSTWRNIGRLSQETLAEMTGTTRSRVSFFMNRFRERGLVQYDGPIRVDILGLNVFLKGQ